jgi:hypothetical protein
MLLYTQLLPMSHCDYAVCPCNFCVAASILQAAWASAADSFAVKCAGCHVGGGNVQQPGATLFTEDLQV